MARLRDKCTRCGSAHPRPVASPLCSPCKAAWRKERNRRAMAAMGGRCVRCGTDFPLVWDHVNDDGYLNKGPTGHRRSVWKAEAKEITKIIQTGQSDRLQLLCPNCNHIKAYFPDRF